jgi:predicted hydrocarbon binding protein
MTEKNSTVELFRTWTETLLSTLEVQFDGDTRAELIEHCGRACALHYGSIERARATKHGAQEIDELLDQLNQQEAYWCGEWVRDGNAIYSVCGECGCPLVGAGLVKLSPTFCECSRGWVKAVFETILDGPVEVELEQTIGRGDPICRFAVRSKT